MRSIFAKLTVWFLATLVVSLAAFFVTPFWFSPQATDPRHVFDSIHQVELELAVEAYERGGQGELARYLGRLDRVLPGRHYLLDAGGHDLLTGEDRSRTRDEARARRVPADAKTAPGGRYTLLLDLPPRPDPFSLIPYYLWIALLVGLMSWAFARYLAKPLQSLRQVVREFGSGDFARRAHFNRRDEFGDLARDFNAMADRIETLLTAERRLLQDVSHELRTPLSRLSLAIELNRRDQAQLEVQRLSALMGELGEMARAEGDPASLPRDAIDLTALIKEIAADHRAMIDVEDGLVCHGRAALIRRAIENVIENAARHSPATTEVEMTARRENGLLVVRVRDQGPGVPPEALEDIFRPFFRVERDRSRDTGGAGLGLAIAQRAIRLHNGCIRAGNAYPGLEVVITLPA
jgi:two-component system sensor histidine kinase CpxA